MVNAKVSSKRSSSNPIDLVYNTYLELEYGFVNPLPENQPEPEELSDLPGLSRHRSPPQFNEGGFANPINQNIPTQPRPLPLTMSYHGFTNQPQRNDPMNSEASQIEPAVKLYYPIGSPSQGYREEWYSAPLVANAVGVRGLNENQGYGNQQSSININPNELYQQQFQIPIFRWKRNIAELQDLAHKCCLGSCTVLDYKSFAEKFRLCPQ